MEETKKTKKVYTSEIVWYAIFGTVWVAGLVLAILGVCAYNVGDRLSNNPLYQAEKSFAALFKRPEGTVWDFRIFGTILMVVAMIGLLIVIFYFSNKIARDEAEARRKEERRRILMASANPAAPAMAKAVDSTSNPVREPESAPEANK